MSRSSRCVSRARTRAPPLVLARCRPAAAAGHSSSDIEKTQWTPSNIVQQTMPNHANLCMLPRCIVTPCLAPIAHALFVPCMHAILGRLHLTTISCQAMTKLHCHNAEVQQMKAHQSVASGAAAGTAFGSTAFFGGIFGSGGGACTRPTHLQMSPGLKKALMYHDICQKQHPERDQTAAHSQPSAWNPTPVLIASAISATNSCKCVVKFHLFHIIMPLGNGIAWHALLGPHVSDLLLQRPGHGLGLHLGKVQCTHTHIMRVGASIVSWEVSLCGQRNNRLRGRLIILHGDDLFDLCHILHEPHVTHHECNHQMMSNYDETIH